MQKVLVRIDPRALNEKKTPGSREANRGSYDGGVYSTHQSSTSPSQGVEANLIN